MAGLPPGEVAYPPSVESASPWLTRSPSWAWCSVSWPAWRGWSASLAAYTRSCGSGWSGGQPAALFTRRVAVADDEGCRCCLPTKPPADGREWWRPDLDDDPGPRVRAV